MTLIYSAFVIDAILISIFFIAKSKKWIKIQIFTGSVCILLFILIVPFVINEMYRFGIKTGTGYETLWEAKDVLAFYGSFLAFLGTSALGGLALWQNQKFKSENDKAQERLERINTSLLELENSKERECLFERYFSYLDETGNLFDPCYIVGDFTNKIEFLDVFYKVKNCQLSLLAKKRRLLFLDKENADNEFFKYIDAKSKEIMEIVSLGEDKEEKVMHDLFQFWGKNCEEHNLKSLDFICEIYNSIYKKQTK